MLTPPTPPTSSTVNSGSSTDSDEVYHRYLQALNQSVSAWIKQHVDINPLIDLTPIFDDYRKHMNDIDAKYQRNPVQLPMEVSTPQISTVTVSPMQLVAPTLTIATNPLASVAVAQRPPEKTVEGKCVPYM